VCAAARLFSLCGAAFGPQETLRPLRGQPVAVLVQVHQREGRAQPLVVFPDTAVAHFGKSENSFEDAKRMLDLALTRALVVSLGAWLFIHMILVWSGAKSCPAPSARLQEFTLGLALIAASPTLLSSPCNKSGSMCLSATLAAVVITECTTVSLLSTPMCALAPKWRVGRGSFPLSRSQSVRDTLASYGSHYPTVSQPHASGETTAVQHPSLAQPLRTALLSSC